MEENNNALPTEEPKTGKKRNYKSATQRISEMKIATANAQHPPVADALKTVGYTDESLAALQAEVAGDVGLFGRTCLAQIGEQRVFVGETGGRPLG